jgi:excisionase family DNA binding protein
MARPSEPTAVDVEGLNLKQVAQQLGVHYMTAYRYVRQGRLPARREGTAWVVDPADVAAFSPGVAPPPDPAEPPGPEAVDWPARIRPALLAGSEVDAWSVVEKALAAAVTPQRVYLDLLAGTVAAIGDDVIRGRATIADQHLATVTAQRVAGRLGTRFRRRGRSRGTVVLGAPLGERHALPIAILADLLRLAGFTVLELGADVPAEAFATAAERAERLVAVGIGVTGVDHLDRAAEVAQAVRDAAPGCPVLLGGQAVRNPEVAAVVDADAWAPDGESAVALVEGLVRSA